MPEYPGGEMALMKFIAANLIYPDDETQGRVVIGFIINEDGTLSDIRVKTSLSPAFDKEALRVVGLISRFIPGKQLDKPVKVAYVLPIRFGPIPDTHTDPRKRK
jgi:TonB family protein